MKTVDREFREKSSVNFVKIVKREFHETVKREFHEKRQV